MIFQLYLFSILLVLPCINSAELQRIKRQSNEGRGVYNSNHPPIRDYESIPVQVIYDEDGLFIEDENEKVEDKKSSPVLPSVNHPPSYFEQDDSSNVSGEGNESEAENKKSLTPKGRSINLETPENVPNHTDLKVSKETASSILTDNEETVNKDVKQESTVSESTTSSITLQETSSPNPPKPILRRQKLKRVQNSTPQNHITEKSVSLSEITQRSTITEAVTPKVTSPISSKRTTESLSTEKTIKKLSASTTLTTKVTQSPSTTEANTPRMAPKYNSQSTSTSKPVTESVERKTEEPPTSSLKENMLGSSNAGSVSKETIVTRNTQRSTTPEGVSPTPVPLRYKHRSTTTLKSVTESAETPTKSSSRRQDHSKEISKTTVAAVHSEEKVIQKDAKSNNNNNKLPSNSNNERSIRGQKQFVPILDSENYVYGHSGNFHYSYEGGDGTKAFSQGVLKSSDDGNTGEAVEGSFSYTDKDGNDFKLSYTADENGYRPVGAHLPTPPPIPPAIQRALAYLATKTSPAAVTEKIIP